MRGLVTGSFLAAVATFIFGALFWTSPLPYGAVREVGSDSIAAALLARIFPDSGLYMLPSPSLSSTDPERYAELHREGPVVTASVVHGAGEPMAAGTLAVGFLHQFVGCLLIGLVLLQVSPALPSLGGRATFIALIGLTAAYWTNLGAVVWWRSPLGWELWNLVHDVVVWIIAGLVMARFTGAAPPVRT
jgi:hypothetical protein